MSNAPSFGQPPNYTQATATAYPSAPGVDNSCYSNPTYPASYQAPSPAQAPYPTSYPGQPAPQPYMTPVCPTAPVQPMPAYPPPSSTGYNQTGYPAATGGQPEGYGAQRYEDEDEIVMSREQPMSGWAGNSFSDKRIRHVFIKKVYLILMVQLLVTLLFVCFFLFYRPVRQWVQENNWFYWCAYGVFLVTYITLVCCDSVRRRWPSNFICLAVFTLAFSYMAGTIASYYETESVVIALGITAAVCLAISLFAIQTKIDFTMCSGLIFAVSMVLIFFGLACIIVYCTVDPSKILQCVYGGLAALVFSLFLVFDTQMVVGGHKRRYQLSAEEHIYGALQLYLDVVNLFLIVLSLGKRS